MQLESKDFYKLTSERTGISGELVKSIGDIVFKTLSDMQRDSPDLILNVEHLGRRFARKAKILEKRNKLDYERTDIARGVSRVTLEQVDADQVILDRLLSRYELFLERKRYFQNLRYGTPYTPEPPVSSQALPAAGETDPREYQGISPRQPPELCIKGGIPETSQASGRTGTPPDLLDSPEISRVL